MENLFRWKMSINDFGKSNEYFQKRTSWRELFELSDLELINRSQRLSRRCESAADSKMLINFELWKEENSLRNEILKKSLFLFYKPINFGRMFSWNFVRALRHLFRNERRSSNRNRWCCSRWGTDKSCGAISSETYRWTWFQTVGNSLRRRSLNRNFACWIRRCDVCSFRR